MRRFPPRLATFDSRRRSVLRLATAALLVGATGWDSTGRAKSRPPTVCADPKALNAAARRQRELDNYVENSPDPKTTCSTCGFFEAGTGPAACGQCRLFNGPANPKGKCDDWTPTGQA
jgi:hypothetical protein